MVAYMGMMAYMITYWWMITHVGDYLIVDDHMRDRGEVPQECVCTHVPQWFGIQYTTPCTHTHMPTTRFIPAAKGMVAVATLVVCTITFSAMDSGRVPRRRCNAANTPYPNMADCRLCMLIHPVCKPKYMLLQHTSDPMMSPAIRDRAVRWHCSDGG